jgi:hypothetical protein
MSGHSLLACLSLNTRLWVKLRSPSHVEIINTSGAGNGMTPVMRHLGTLAAYGRDIYPTTFDIYRIHISDSN